MNFQQSVVLNLELSHWCSVKDHIWNSDYRPVTSGEPTHDWEFKIQDGAKADMRHYIEKIVIKLHETFAEPVKGKILKKSTFLKTSDFSTTIKDYVGSHF